jgi:hypothetical protein
LAQRIAEQQKIPDFLVPLKVDGSELDWMTTAVSYISFMHGWADGWRALLEKLESISTSRSLVNAAPLAASSFPRGDDLLSKTGEELLTNIVRVKSFPSVLRVFRVAGTISAEDWKHLDANMGVLQNCQGRVGSSYSAAVGICGPHQADLGTTALGGVRVVSQRPRA